MEPSSGAGGISGAAAYEALMARQSKNQQRTDGANAVRLVEAARVQPTVTVSKTLPPGATISIRA